MAIMIRMEDSTAESFIEHLLEQISERDQNHQAMSEKTEDLRTERNQLQDSLRMQKVPDPITPEQMIDMIDPNFVNNKKIEGIKTIRQMTRMGLKEAKEFFEQVWIPAIRHRQSAEASGREVDMDEARQKAKEIF